MTEEELQETEELMEETLEEPEDVLDDTDIVIDTETVQVVETPVYEFTVTGQTHPDYQCCSAIVQWIQTNLEGLTDDYNNALFSKVNLGYNSDTIKGFGKKPVADVYIDTLSYGSDFDNNKPDNVHSFIICYLKGNMNNAYLKACELTDYLIQQFEESEAFRDLEDIVRYARVANVELQIIPNGKTYGVLCAFELEHELY